MSRLELLLRASRETLEPGAHRERLAEELRRRAADRGVAEIRSLPGYLAAMMLSLACVILVLRVPDAPPIGEAFGSAGPPVIAIQTFDHGATAIRAWRAEQLRFGIVEMK